MATILRLGSCRCGGAEKLDHDGAGYVMCCQTCGRQRYDWKGQARGESMHKYLETPNPINGGGGIKPAVTLEEALALPQRRHPVVKWDIAIHCTMRRQGKKRPLRFDVWAEPPQVLALVGQVEAGFLIWKEDRERAWIQVDTIRLRYSLEFLSVDEQSEIRDQFRLTICRSIGKPCAWHDAERPWKNGSCRNVRAIPELALTWELDAPPLIQGE
jgi:hypothetical protein